MKIAQIKRLISDEWRELSAEEKRLYFEKANVGREANKQANQKSAEDIPQRPQKRLKVSQNVNNLCKYMIKFFLVTKK